MKPIGRRRRRRRETMFKNTTTPSKARRTRKRALRALLFLLLVLHRRRRYFLSLSLSLLFVVVVSVAVARIAHIECLSPVLWGDDVSIARSFDRAEARSANPSKCVVKRIVVFSLRHLLLGGPTCGFCFCAASSRRLRRWTRGRRSLKISAPSSNLPIRKSRRF